MATILGLKCIYDTKNQAWAVELALEGEPATTRFTIGGAEDVETFLEAFEESTSAQFDPESGEVTFTFEYAFAEEDEDEEDEEDFEDEDEEDEKPKKKGK